MADKRISELPDAAPLTGAELFPIVQGGQTKKTDFSTMVLYAGNGTVSSVSVSGTDGISVTGSPITTDGTITLGLGNITPDSVTAGGNITGANLSGTNTGDQTITLTGDVTGSGAGAIAATITNSSVTYAKMQNASTSSILLGRGSAGSGSFQEITLSGLTMSGTVLTVSAGGGGSGSVTYVGITGNTGINVASSPITSSGTIALSLDATLSGISTLSGTGFVASNSADAFIYRSFSSAGGISITNPDGVSGDPVVTVGTLKQVECIDGGSLLSTLANGPDMTQIAMTTNLMNFRLCAFDPTAIEYTTFVWVPPKNWDEGAVTYRVRWTANSASADSVVWALQGVAVSDDDTLDVAFGTAITITDANKAVAYDLNVTDESSAVTIAGTPAAGDSVHFRFYRDATNGSDTLAVDALPIAVEIFYNINTLTVA